MTDRPHERGDGTEPGEPGGDVPGGDAPGPDEPRPASAGLGPRRLAAAAAVVLLGAAAWVVSGRLADGVPGSVDATATRTVRIGTVDATLDLTATSDGPTSGGAILVTAVVTMTNTADSPIELRLGPCGDRIVFDVPAPGHVGRPAPSPAAALAKAAMRTPAVDGVEPGVDLRLRRAFDPGAGSTAPCPKTDVDASVAIPGAGTVERRGSIRLTAADVAWGLDGAEVGLDLALPAGSPTGGPTGGSSTGEPPGGAPRPGAAVGGAPVPGAADDGVANLVIDLADLTGRDLVTGRLTPVAALDLALADPLVAAVVETRAVGAVGAAESSVEATTEGSTWRFRMGPPTGVPPGSSPGSDPGSTAGSTPPFRSTTGAALVVEVEVDGRVVLR